MGCGCPHARDPMTQAPVSEPPPSGVRPRRRRAAARRSRVAWNASTSDRGLPFEALRPGQRYFIAWREYGVGHDEEYDEGRGWYRLAEVEWLATGPRLVLVPVTRSRRERRPIYLFENEIDSIEEPAEGARSRDPADVPPPPSSGVRRRQTVPAMDAGPALARGIRQSERTWEPVIVDRSIAFVARFVDFRRIDGEPHAVWTLGNMLYAQPSDPDRFRRDPQVEAFLPRRRRTGPRERILDAARFQFGPRARVTILERGGAFWVRNHDEGWDYIWEDREPGDPYLARVAPSGGGSRTLGGMA